MHHAPWIEVTICIEWNKKKWLLRLADRGERDFELPSQPLSCLEMHYNQWDHIRDDTESGWLLPPLLQEYLGQEALCVVTHHLSVFFAGCLQAYMYLGEGERLLKSLTNEDSWSQTFEYATFYSLKGEVRNHWGWKGIISVLESMEGVEAICIYSICSSSTTTDSYPRFSNPSY